MKDEQQLTIGNQDLVTFLFLHSSFATMGESEATLLERVRA